MKYTMELSGPSKINTNWDQYIHVPPPRDPMCGMMKSKYIKKHQPEGKYVDQFLKKDELTSPILIIARQFRDEQVFGKPNFQF